MQMEGSMPTPNNEQLYLDATKEVDSGTQDPALWAKAMALAEGDEDKARYRYITLRVEKGPGEDRRRRLIHLLLVRFLRKTHRFPKAGIHS